MLEYRRETIEHMNGLRPARDGKRRRIRLRRDGAGKILGVTPEMWIDAENDIMDSDTWSGAVAQEIRERDLVEEIMLEDPE